MKPFQRILCSLALLSLLAACGTVQEHRARQFSSDWQALAPDEQSRLGSATIAVGDTSKHVYIALGSPNYTLPFDQATRTWTWVYWGIVPEDAPANDATLRFLSRSELRLPRSSDRRQALHLTFANARLVRWELAEIDVNQVQFERTVEMGRFPRL